MGNDAVLAPTIVHATGIQQWNRCKRQYYFSSVLRMEPVLPDSRLRFGTMFHKAMASYYRQQDVASVVDAEAEAERQRLSEVFNGEIPENVGKRMERDLGLLPKMVAGYIAWAQSNDPNDFEQVMFVEESFETPVFPGVPLLHRGTFDLVVRDHMDRIWIVDHKTTQGFSGQEVHLNPQMGLYLLAAHQLWPNDTIGGIYYTMTRKVDPTHPNTKTATTMRLESKRNQHSLSLLQNRLARIGDSIRIERTWDPSPGEHCRYCPFLSPCVAMESGEDYEALLQGHYRSRPQDISFADDSQEGMESAEA